MEISAIVTGPALARRGSADAASKPVLSSDVIREILLNGSIVMLLGASTFHIAVSAALRMALPEANAAIYLTLSLGVTFPFNVLTDIPLSTRKCSMTRSPDVGQERGRSFFGS